MGANLAISPTRRRFLDSFSPEKLRGGYYTDLRVAKWICAWAISTPEAQVLEPSCGDGAFVEGVARRLIALEASPNGIPAQVKGIELTPAEAEKAARRFEATLGVDTGTSIEPSDFFQWLETSSRRFDVVVGNPPFLRYHAFPEPSRTKGMELMAGLGLSPNRLTNIWVPFVVGAVSVLRPGGRLAMVVPAELLQVTYAAQLRRFLVDRFSSIDIVTCNELFFEAAEQEVVLLLADGKLEPPSLKNECYVRLHEFSTIEAVLATQPSGLGRRSEKKLVDHNNEKWLKYFLAANEIDLMRRLRAIPEITPISEFAAVEVGIVTGNNDFFVLSEAAAKQWQLEKFLSPLVGRSQQLQGAILNRSDWTRLAQDGQRVFLFSTDRSEASLPAGASRYVQHGRTLEVHTGFKCSIRDPWYSVPSVWKPDGFMFRQIYDFPRLVANRTSATSTDTIHRLRCRVDPVSVITSAYTHLFAASAEIEGRSYGGGVLELEPNEAERLLMPKTLGGGVPLEDIDKLVRNGKLAAVLEENDRLILKKGIGLDSSDCRVLSQIWTKMRERRGARRKKKANHSV